MTLIQTKTHSKRAMLFGIALLASLSLTTAQAQIKRTNNVFYRGFDVSFGIRQTTIKSNITKINGIDLLTEGGSAGFVYGTEVLRSKVNAGFYYSAASVRQTIDQFHAGKTINFYPVALIRKKVSPLEFYLLSGVNYDIYKFAGNYFEKDGPSNPAVNDDYIGKVSQISANVGGGIEYKFFDNLNFLHLYGEIQQGLMLSSSSSYASFKNTSAGNQTIATIGVRFGLVN